MSGSRIIVALDFATATDALVLVDRLQPQHCRLKVGKELFTRCGPDFVKTLVARGFDVFLDLKYHDIPNTVAKACLAAADLGVWMINVHALGGQRMLAAARESLTSHPKPPLLIAVTVLTSISVEDLVNIGLPATSVAATAERLAALAYAEGLNGVVCSAHEARALKARFGPEFQLVTPGIRLATDAQDDQRRVMTPEAAIQVGADYLVIGRSLTQSDNPVGKLLRLNSDIDALA